MQAGAVLFSGLSDGSVEGAQGGLQDMAGSTGVWRQQQVIVGYYMLLLEEG